MQQFAIRVLETVCAILIAFFVIEAVKPSVNLAANPATNVAAVPKTPVYAWKPVVTQTFDVHTDERKLFPSIANGGRWKIDVRAKSAVNAGFFEADTGCDVSDVTVSSTECTLESGQDLSVFVRDSRDNTNFAAGKAVALTMLERDGKAIREFIDNNRVSITVSKYDCVQNCN
jgi:hypothetical protein